MPQTTRCRMQGLLGRHHPRNKSADGSARSAQRSARQEQLSSAKPPRVSPDKANVRITLKVLKRCKQRMAARHRKSICAMRPPTRILPMSFTEPTVPQHRYDSMSALGQKRTTSPRHWLHRVTKQAVQVCPLGYLAPTHAASAIAATIQSPIRMRRRMSICCQRVDFR